MMWASNVSANSQDQPGHKRLEQIFYDGN